MTKRSSHLCQLQAREFDVHAAFHGQVSWQLLSVRTSWPRTVCPDLFLRQSRNCNKSRKLFSNKMIISLLNGHLSSCISVSRYQNVSILDFIGAKDEWGGGDNWSYKTCKASVKMSPPTNQDHVSLQVRCPSCRPINSVRALNGTFDKMIICK